jgi:hypothetical protein
MSLQERQAELIDAHRAVQDEELSYVLVGGWAISAFQTRFTTDVDMVIPETERDAYDALLTELGYSKAFDNDVANVYEGRIVRYQKPVGDYAVEFDALVGALRCRQTDAEWSYRCLHKHSVVESLEVAEGMMARIPEPALLFALKLHSGRLADARDLVIVGAEADLDSIEQHIHRGNPNQLAEQIERVLAELESDEFADSFRGVFQQKELPEDNIDDLIQFLRTQFDRL